MSKKTTEPTRAEQFEKWDRVLRDFPGHLWRASVAAAEIRAAAMWKDGGYANYTEYIAATGNALVIVSGFSTLLKKRTRLKEMMITLGHSELWYKHWDDAGQHAFERFNTHITLPWEEQWLHATRSLEALSDSLPPEVRMAQAIATVPGLVKDRAVGKLTRKKLQLPPLLAMKEFIVNRLRGQVQTEAMRLWENVIDTMDWYNGETLK